MLAHILILTIKLLQQAKDHCPILGLAKGLSFWKAKNKMEILPKRDVNIATRFALLNDIESLTKKEIEMICPQHFYNKS